MTFGSLFTGIGGLDLGLERAGLTCRWQVEIDPFCNRVLEKHWAGVKRYGDITKLTGNELEPVDLIAGGFPCQDLSQAGKRTGIEGTRSGLWFEFARLVGILGPRYVLIENVPGILDWRAIPRVCGELARLGYVGSWRCLRASDFGASHLRKRVFVVAHTAINAGTFDELGDSGGERSQGIFQTGAAQRATGRSGGTVVFAPGPSDPRWPAILRERPDLSPALESPLCRVANGLPDPMDGALSNRTRRLKALGNSVVPQCAEYIGRVLMEYESCVTGASE